jgi:hypothetical protein
MSNVDSSGGIGGRIGRSMDCSQLMEIRRKYVGVNAMQGQNPQNVPSLKPRFNQDKMTRDPATNGAVNFYFSRGLNAIFSQIGSPK